MGIFLLFIPLFIFIAAEGVILYFLINIIASAITNYGFSSSTVVDNTYSAATAIIFVLLLMIFIGLAILIYIMTAIRPAIKSRKMIMSASAQPYPQYDNQNAPYNAQHGQNSLNTYRQNPQNHQRMQHHDLPKKKKSKAKLIIIAVILLLIGAAAYMFIFQRTFVMGLIFGDNIPDFLK